MKKRKNKILKNKDPCKNNGPCPSYQNVWKGDHYFIRDKKNEGSRSQRDITISKNESS